MTPPRQRRPQLPMAQRRAELTQVALRVMARDGAWALTTRAVAAEAGVPHGSVHYAFSSKEALLQAVIAADTDSAVHIFSSVGAAGGSPEEVLARAFSAYVDHLVADPDIELALQELTLMAVRDTALAELFRASEQGYADSLTRLLGDVADQARGRWAVPVPVLVDQLLGLLFGATVAWLVHRDETRLRAALTDAAHATASRLEPDSRS